MPVLVPSKHRILHDPNLLTLKSYRYHIVGLILAFSRCDTCSGNASYFVIITCRQDLTLPGRSGRYHCADYDDTDDHYECGHAKSILYQIHRCIFGHLFPYGKGSLLAPRNLIINLFFLRSRFSHRFWNTRRSDT